MEVFVLQLLLKKCREQNNDLQMIFIDLEKYHGTQFCQNIRKVYVKDIL